MVEQIKDRRGYFSWEPGDLVLVARDTAPLSAAERRGERLYEAATRMSVAEAFAAFGTSITLAEAAVELLVHNGYELPDEGLETATADLLAYIDKSLNG